LKKSYKKKIKNLKNEVKRMLELKELVEEREGVWLEKAKGESNEKLLKLKKYKLRRRQAKLKRQNYKLRELGLKELYNLRYREEKEEYLRNLEAKKAYSNLLN
jgi:hypothetical protein